MIPEGTGSAVCSVTPSREWARSGTAYDAVRRSVGTRSGRRTSRRPWSRAPRPGRGRRRLADSRRSASAPVRGTGAPNRSRRTRHPPTPARGSPADLNPLGSGTRPAGSSPFALAASSSGPSAAGSTTPMTPTGATSASTSRTPASTTGASSSPTPTTSPSAPTPRAHPARRPRPARHSRGPPRPPRPAPPAPWSGHPAASCWGSPLRTRPSLPRLGSRCRSRPARTDPSRARPPTSSSRTTALPGAVGTGTVIRGAGIARTYVQLLRTGVLQVVVPRTPSPAGAFDPVAPPLAQTARFTVTIR